MSSVLPTCIVAVSTEDWWRWPCTICQVLGPKHYTMKLGRVIGLQRPKPALNIILSGGLRLRFRVYRPSGFLVFIGFRGLGLGPRVWDVCVVLHSSDLRGLRV